MAEKYLLTTGFSRINFSPKMCYVWSFGEGKKVWGYIKEKKQKERMEEEDERRTRREATI